MNVYPKHCIKHSLSRVFFYLSTSPIASEKNWKLKEKKKVVFIFLFLFPILIFSVVGFSIVGFSLEFSSKNHLESPFLIVQNSLENSETKKTPKKWSVSDIQKKAAKFLQEKQYSQLIQYLLSIPPEKRSVTSQSFLAEAYIREKRYSEAQELLEKEIDKTESIRKNTELRSPSLLEKSADSSLKARLYSLLGLSYEGQGKLDSALSEYEKVKALFPDHPNSWHHLARVAFKKKKYSESSSLYQKAYELDDSSRSIMLGLAGSFRAEKLYEKAFVLYRKLISLYPNDPILYFSLGNLLIDLGKKQFAHQRFAEGYFLQTNYRKALKELDSIPELSKNLELYPFLISNLIQLGQMKRAREEIEKAKELYPQKEIFFFLQTQILFLEKEYEKAISFSKDFLKQFQNSYSFRVMIANSLSALGKKKEAIPWYEEILKTKQSDIRARQNLAQLYRELNQSSTDRSSDRSFEFFHQGIVYFYTGDFTQAKIVLSWVREDFSRNSELLYYKGLIHWALKESDEALKSFFASIEQDSKSSLPYLALTRIYREKALELSSECRNKIQQQIQEFLEGDLKNSDSPELKELKEEYKNLIRNIKPASNTKSFC